MTETRREATTGLDAADFPIELSPDPSLLTYYVLVSLIGGPLFPLILLPLYFRYATLRFRLDAEGIRMRRGMLFRREVSLAYRRIQDIHLSSNVVERWLGLGKVRVQTASGGAEAEITVEGLKDTDALRDFLYRRSRGRGRRERTGRPAGSRPVAPSTHPGSMDPGVVGGPAEGDALVEALGDVLTEVRSLRKDLARPDGR